MKKVLLQLDSDAQASVFDSVVAVDCGVDHLLTRQAVELTAVRELVYGAMFTRGPDELHNTAVFVGGSNVSLGEAILKQVVGAFFGPMRVSVMIDSNGSNTTAAAAVVAAARHVPLAGATVLVLAATGPVGQRVVRLLAREKAAVRVASRSRDRAAEACAAASERVPGATLEPFATGTPEEFAAALEGAQVVISAGAPRVALLTAAQRRRARDLRVAIDLNAVPPLGLEGILVQDKAAERDGQIGYGAVGVGGTKMKIHKAALRALFERNDLVLDAEEIFALAQKLESAEGE